uniref:Uncharacterized protein n=1 Tax=Anguilla anguilla TaxID=7936 RepID=A0A0E9X2G6_ANGAN
MACGALLPSRRWYLHVVMFLMLHAFWSSLLVTPQGVTSVGCRHLLVGGMYVRFYILREVHWTKPRSPPVKLTQTHLVEGHVQTGCGTLAVQRGSLLHTFFGA